MSRSGPFVIALLMGGLLHSQAAKSGNEQPPEAATVLVLVNDTVPPREGTGRKGASEWVGESYAMKRGIPSSNILHLRIPNTEDPLAWDSWHISWSSFDTYMRQPILKALTTRRNASPIRYIVPVWGVPSHLADLPGYRGENWSIDSFLASLRSGNLSLGLPNPYFANARDSKAHFLSWTNPQGWQIFLVTRLDGPTPQIALGLADKAIRAEAALKPSDGTAYLDYRHVACCGDYYEADQTVLKVQQLSRDHGFRTVLNDQAATGTMIQNAPDTLWAWGWYSGPATTDGYRFVEGAVGAQLTSYTADGIRIPRPGSWVELWLRRGITATWGATTEPTVSGYTRADSFFSYFWDGYNFAESSYLSTPFLNHAMVMVGDPLYAPRVFRSRDR